MHGVAVHRPRKRGHEMEVFLKVVEDSLNLWPASKKLPLTFGHELFSLCVVRRGENTRAEGTSYLLVQRNAAVAAVANGKLGVLVHEHWYSSAVVNVSAGKGNGTEFAVVVDGGMELEAVMLTLPVVARMGDAPGNPVPAPPHQLADWQHSGVHEAKRCFAF